MTAHLTGDPVEVHWAAPDWPGSAPITTYRAKVYRWVTGKHMYASSCTTNGPTFTCTTDNLTGTGGLFVRVAAKNRHGYGTPTTYIPVSQAQAAGQ